jgi:hypothetical protein
VPKSRNTHMYGSGLWVAIRFAIRFRHRTTTIVVVALRAIHFFASRARPLRPDTPPPRRDLYGHVREMANDAPIGDLSASMTSGQPFCLLLRFTPVSIDVFVIFGEGWGEKGYFFGLNGTFSLYRIT